MKNDSINKGYPSDYYPCSLFLLWAFILPDLQRGNHSEHNEIKQEEYARVENPDSILWTQLTTAPSPP